MDAVRKAYRKFIALSNSGRVGSAAATNLVVMYFNLLFITGAVALSFGVPFVFKNKLGGALVTCLLLVIGMAGRNIARNGRPIVALNMYAPLFWVICVAHVTFSHRVGLAGILVCSFVPVYAAVAGFGRALTFSASFLIYSVAFAIALAMGVPIPQYFPGGLLPELLILIFSVPMALLPLPSLFRQLNRALANSENEVNERRLAEAELKRTAERLIDFSRNASDWFWETDTLHRFSYLSQHAGKKSQRPIIGLKPWEANAAPDAAHQVQWNELKQQLDKNQPFRDMELALVVANGDVHWISISGTPKFTDDGQFLGYRGSTTNITTRKISELEISRARDAAESSNRSKSQFLANLSHEIRTPLNGILGMAGLLEMMGVSDEQHPYLEELKQSAKHLQGMLDRIIDFAEIEAGHAALRHDLFHLQEVATMAVERQRGLASKKGLALSLNFASDLPDLACGDGNRILQVLSDLAENAVKFTETGSVSLTVQRGSTPSTERHFWVDFAIADTGIGLSRAQLDHLFEAFSQADGSITRRAGGNGLGLAICQSLVTAMGGRIAVDSTPGEGSIFRVSLALEKHT